MKAGPVQGAHRILLTSLLLLWCLAVISGCSDPRKMSDSELDPLLAKARAEGKIVMLELGSVGCIPCENMRPILERLRQEYSESLEVIFIDVKRERHIAARYGVFSIPVQVFINRDGEEFHRHIGFYPYEEILPVLSSAGR